MHLCRIFFVVLVFSPLVVWGGGEVRLASNYILDTHSLSKNQKGSTSYSLGALLLSSELEMGASLFTASLLATHSAGSPTDFVGDLQVLSNIDVQGQEGVKLYELNYEYRSGGGRISLGWFDLSTSFNTTEPSELLINSSFGASAEFANTGYYGPSIYPFPAFGIKYTADMGGDFYIQGAFVDPIVASQFRSKNIQSHINLNKDQHLAVVEVGRRKEKNFEAALGLWNLNLEDALVGDFYQSGVYTQIDYRINSYVRPFFRQGFASRVSARIYSNTVLGARLLPEHNDYGLIELGFSGVRIEGKSRSEQVYEVLYQRRPLSNLSIALSYQYISRPGGDAGSANAATLRLRFDFDWTATF